MPHFAELARVHSSEQAELNLARSRSATTKSNLNRPAVFPETNNPQLSSSSTETLAMREEEEGQVPGEADLESNNPKVKAEVISKPEEADQFLVTLKGREHLNPHTWSTNYRWALTMFAALLALNATFASSAPSNLIPSIIEHFNVSEEIGILLISIFVAGYVMGPLLWGPLSERYGRKKVYLIAFYPYFAFQIACAVAPNIGSLLAFRFIGGVFASSPLTNSGGVIADLWGPDRRGDALAWFSLAPFFGPAIAPIVSGYMEVTRVYYTWIFWLLAAFAGVCALAIQFFLPETYVPYILYKEAKRLRKETGDNGYHSALEDMTSKEGPKEVLQRTILKPFIMIIQEPMLLAITIYMSFIYGIIYLLFEAVPIIFIGQHGLNFGEAGLVFLTLPVGGIIAVMTYIYYYNPQYMRQHRSVAPKAVAPEFRLKPLLFAAPAFALSLFWIGFTSYRGISIASPILALTLLGGCVLLIFLGCFNYLIDTYLMNAASALSINTVVRSSLGAGFPLFATAMHNKLGVPGATGLLAGLAVIFVPIPFFLLKYGRKIREMSKNAVVREES